MSKNKIAPTGASHSASKFEAMDSYNKRADAIFWLYAPAMTRAWQSGDKYWMSYCLKNMCRYADETTDEIYCNWKDKFDERYG